ncbi:ubiquitin carboxyl-terminal hydrolase 30 homolog [Fopius arisanus]|uniref:ubiquitinyl hydrolase 1 n=1 Tax=Fopius arisanus TaxID=64838 RepID=A0A9R1TNM5_9HYME|nr:PREDICTED: ubiquitin carboxyl-terminal hydrolase 30 homolog [Fopius arisanus]
MDVERLAVFAGIGFALGVGAFVLWGPTPRPRRRGQVAGITNLGFTCFLNSLLQALGACPVFLKWLNERAVKSKDTSFTSNLALVLDRVNGFTDDLYGNVTPIEVITSLGPLWSFEPGYQDAHDLFHVMLMALQNETQTPTRKFCLSDALPSPPGSPQDALTLRSVSCNDLPQEEPSRLLSSSQNMTSSTRSIPSSKPGVILARSSEVLTRYLTDESSPRIPERAWRSLCALPQVTPLGNENHPFSGFLTSQLKCTRCQWRSPVRYDKLETVSLPLPPGDTLWRRHTLGELFARLVTSEVINNVECDGCGTRSPALKTLTMGKLPRCLCIHILRTTWGTGAPVKRDDVVIFPEVFVLDPFTFNEAKKRNGQATLPVMGINSGAQGKHKYRLRAVIEHRGRVDTGHFVCYRRGNWNNQWIYTSDNVVEKTSLTDVLCANPYLMFYERIDGV